MQKQARQQKQARPTERMYCAFNQVSSYSTRVLLAFTCALMMIGAAFAQSTTDGAIGGTVQDNTGAVVAKAKVLVHNNGTNAEKSATTDNSGYYRVNQLQTGTYTVTINQQGFSPFKVPEVVVQVGALTDLSPHLVVGGTVETVQVTSETPQINYNSPELAATLNQTAISNLPINGGRWSNFALLTPGVVSNSSGFGLMSFRGISTLLNNNTVDGADNNQAFFSEERGRTRAGYSTPKVAIEEFQVNTSNYSAEYGRSAGGVVNTVTKSGSNSLHGETYFYDRDNGWGATNPFAKIQVRNSTGGFTGVPFKPKDWRKMTGFGVGGPAIKDKLFWFLAFDYYIRNFPGFGVASNPTVFFGTPTCQGTPNVIVFPCTAGSTIGTLATRVYGVHNASTDAQAFALYNTDLAALNTMLGPVPRTGEQFIFLPKIDWMINQKNHASFSFNRMRWSSPAGIQTQGTNTNGIASFGNDFVKDTWGVAKLDTFITTNLANEVRYQYGRDFEFQNNQTPTPYEQSTLVNTPTFTNPLGLPPQVSITNGFTFGTPSFLLRKKFPDETRHQIADTLSWSHGKHSFKFGMDFSRVHDNSQNLRNQFASYSYSNLLNYFSDLNKPRSCPGGVPCYTSYSQAFGPLGFQFSTNDIAFFAEDNWKILPRLSLSLGLRYEYEMLPDPFSNLINSAIPQSAHMPSDKNNIGPRAGFAYDIFGDGKTVLRGGYGIFYGRIINSTIFTALTSSGIVGSQLGYSFSPSALGAPAFPTILTTQPPLTIPPNVAFFDRNFQNPLIHQADLALEHNFGWDTVLSISYLGSFGRELPGFTDLNINPSTSTNTYKVVNGGPITTPTLTEPVFSTRPTAAYAAMTDIFSGINSKYQALSTQLNHHLSHNIQFSVNYTWAHALDFGQNEATFSDVNDLLTPGNLRGEYGNSIYDVRHRFVISAVATSPWKKSGWLGYITNGWQISPIFQTQSGLPYSLTTSGSAPGGEQFAGGGINGSGGAFRIDAIGRNTFRMPATYVQDLRVSKEFSFQERYKLEFLADVFNLANHTNVTGVTTNGYSIVSSGSINTPTGPAVSCSTASPCLSYNVNSTTFAPVFGTATSANSNFAYSPRQLQLGLRFKF